MRKTAVLVVMIMFSVLSGCTSKTAKHDPLETSKEVSKMLMSEGPFPDSDDFKVLGIVKIQHLSYFGATDMESDLARKAAELGADAVIQVETGRRAYALCFSAPYGRGIAIKILNKSMDMSSFKVIYF